MSQAEVSFEQIGGLVMNELHRRLGAPELAQDLPGTLLMKVAGDYIKHIERRNEIEQAKLEQEHVNPLEIVDQEGLPLEMRFEILTEYLDEVESAWRHASARMEDLLKEVNANDPDVVQDVPDVVSEG